MKAADEDEFSKSDLKRRLAKFVKRNKTCADCPERMPPWCSIVKPPARAPIGSEPLVACLCFHCAGLHRRFGTQVCRVKSTTLDEWTRDEVLAAEASGNVVLNRIYEDGLHKANPRMNFKPLEGAHSGTKERYIRSKYIELSHYSKNAHCDYLNVLKSPTAFGSTIKSPLQKLGVFLHNEKASLTKIGSKSKSVCSSTLESSGDEITFSSAPALRVSSNQSSPRTGGSKIMANQQMERNPNKGICSDLDWRSTNTYSNEQRFLDSFEKLEYTTSKLGLKELLASKFTGSNNKTIENLEHHGSVTESNVHHKSCNNIFLEKQAPLHKDQRRAAVHTSKYGFDLSPEEVSNEKIQASSEAKLRSSRHKLLSSLSTKRIHSSNSRINLYAHKSRGRSSGKENLLEPKHPRCGRARQENEESETRIRDGRGRSRSAKKGHDITTVVSPTRRERSESARAARSSSKQWRAMALNSTIRQRAQSRARRSRSNEPSTRMDRDPLKFSNHSRRERALEYKVTMIPSKKSTPQYSENAELLTANPYVEDLSGVILIFDESSKTYNDDIYVLDSPKQSHRKSRTSKTERSIQSINVSKDRRFPRHRSGFSVDVKTKIEDHGAISRGSLQASKQSSPTAKATKISASHSHGQSRNRKNTHRQIISGEDDFHVIATNQFCLGRKGSNHSCDSGSFAKPYKGPSNSIRYGTTVKDKRRCSRTTMAARNVERQNRKSDICASLDREEDEKTKITSPLLRNLPTRIKSGDGALVGVSKSQLQIHPFALRHSKSMDIKEMAKPAQCLELAGKTRKS